MTWSMSIDIIQSKGGPLNKGSFFLCAKITSRNMKTINFYIYRRNHHDKSISSVRRHWRFWFRMDY